jgi:protein TonB
MKNQTPIKFLILLLVICAWIADPNAVKAQEAVQKEVDEMPVPPGGMEGFTNYMIQNLKYPATAKEAKIEGMVMITFVVKSDGSVDAVEVLRGIGGGCDEEAVRVVKNSGIWSPGKKEGKAVAARMTLPVQFKM